MEAERVRVRATVRGRVQAVGFRAFVLQEAEELEIGGTVANRPDRSVEVVAEGPQAAVDALLRRLEKGPTSARVDAVEVVRETATGDLPPMRVTA